MRFPWRFVVGSRAGRAATAALLALALLLGCSPPAERAERARADADAALNRGDRAAALQALQTLRALGTSASVDPIELAQRYVLAGEASQAVWLLEEAVRESPSRDELRIALAKAALLVADAAAARETLHPIQRGSPVHAAALVLRAQAELQLGDFDQAVATLDEAEELYPERPEAKLARIGALLREHRFDEARGALEAAREPLTSAGAAEALRRFEIALGVAEAERGRLDAAIGGLRALARGEPDDPEGWQALARVLLRAGRADEASAELRAALEEDPERVQLLPLLASLHRAAGRPEEARRALGTLVERSPSPAAYLALVRHHLAQGEIDRAVEVLDQALGRFPEETVLQRSRAEELVIAGRLDEAREAIGDFAARFPDDPHSEYLRALLELAQGDAASAAERLGAVLPRLDRAWTQHWLGAALEALGDLAGAERRYGLALLRSPGDPALYPPLIRLAERRGDWSDSAALARQLARTAPGLYEGWAALVRAHVELGSGPEAVNAGRRVAALFPERADAQLWLVRALRTDGQHDAALALLDATESRLGATAELAAERVLTLGLAGRLDEGIEGAHRALADHPDSAALHTALASLLFAAGRAEEGDRAVDRALELEPEDPQPLRLRARFRTATGRFHGARRDAARYLEKRPEDAGAHFVLGVAEERAGDAERAIASYRRAAALDPAAFGPRNNLALLLAERDLDGALAAAQEAYALRSDSPAVLDTLGWLYLRKGLVERATSLLEEAHAAAPALAEVQLHLALAHREAGRTEDARRLLVALAGRDDASPELGAQVDEALRSLP